MVHHGRAAEAAKPVRVFILAGQSNMEGKAKLSLLNYQAEQPATRTLFAKYRADGKWVERDDVWIKFLERSGRLTVGFCNIRNLADGHPGLTCQFSAAPASSNWQINQPIRANLMLHLRYGIGCKHRSICIGY